MQEINKKEVEILEAKIMDKYRFCNSKNKITYTDFLDMYARNIAEKLIEREKLTNYIFFGGNADSNDRVVLLFYPEKLSEELCKENFENIFEVIKIELPNELKGTYKHSDYLSGIMKFGLKREKFGDIIVNDNGAEIIALKEISEYIKNKLQLLTRFRKSKIELLNINELEKNEQKFEEYTGIVTSLRLDNFVSELARCSRSKAVEIIEEAKVFVNSENELRIARKMNIGDVIRIRGKGKFIFDSIERETSSGRIAVNIKKYL